MRLRKRRACLALRVSMVGGDVDLPGQLQRYRFASRHSPASGDGSSDGNYRRLVSLWTCKYSFDEWAK